ncbi:sulfotransferase domain-containing protein [Agaribacter marinus]|uniref:Sulfotransferase domain-containing protein n=1 Tax=Agaribacter marinus TaxID=1431249 RepID=A0AA37T1U1_9ALTE|nr:sulfotransferase domain-containing protein [Agaribacter marinus]GLR70868.1 hypothetical protein GCM10007852_17760 [Agaribacter marinus]
MTIDKITLISGVPRSGTTLCCHLLNKQQHVVALHEPLNPKSINIYDDNAAAVISFEARKLYGAVRHGLPFEHGDICGLNISNPIGQERDVNSGRRQQTAQRGRICVADYIGKDFLLVIKQNALFTAYLDKLLASFNVVCIVRNPVDVLLSWWTVDLPIGRGHIPAGENNDEKLKRRLQNVSVIKRQLLIYEWFCERYFTNNADVIAYEEIVKSDGVCLFEKMQLNHTKPQPLSFQERVFPQHILERLEMHESDILRLNTSGYYSPRQIAERIKDVLNG